MSMDDETRPYQASMADSPASSVSTSEDRVFCNCPHRSTYSPFESTERLMRTYTRAQTAMDIASSSTMGIPFLSTSEKKR